MNYIVIILIIIVILFIFNYNSLNNSEEFINSFNHPYRGKYAWLMNQDNIGWPTTQWPSSGNYTGRPIENEDDFGINPIQRRSWNGSRNRRIGHNFNDLRPRMPQHNDQLEADPVDPISNPIVRPPRRRPRRPQRRSHRRNDQLEAEPIYSVDPITEPIDDEDIARRRRRRSHRRNDQLEAEPIYSVDPIVDLIVDPIVDPIVDRIVDPILEDNNDYEQCAWGIVNNNLNNNLKCIEMNHNFTDVVNYSDSHCKNKCDDKSYYFKLFKNFMKKLEKYNNLQDSLNQKTITKLWLKYKAENEFKI